jgi:HEAT repeat protein
MNQLLKCLAVACVCLGLSNPAHAQVTQTFTSLEALVAGAEDVVRGPIVKVTRDVKVPKDGKDADGTQWPRGLVEYTFTVRIDETLRGKKAGEIELIRTTSARDMRYPQWCDAGTEFLWFLGQRDVYANVTHGDTDRKWGAIRLGDPVASERDYCTHTPPIFAMDFRVLTSREDILAAARNVAASIARSPRKRIEFATIDLPGDIAVRCRATSARDFFKVPIVAELEPIARKMITAPHELIPGFVPGETSQKFLRLGGVEFLGHFKSDENAELLKGLLDDSFYFVFDEDQHGKPLKQPVRKYVTRTAAYQILKRWKVAVPKPVLKEPHIRKSDATRSAPQQPPEQEKNGDGQQGKTDSPKAEPLILEVQTKSRDGLLRLEVMVTPGTDFRVSSSLKRAKWTLHGSAENMVGGVVAIRYSIERSNDAGPTVIDRQFKIDELDGFAWVGIIGGSSITRSWLRRGVDPVPVLNRILARRDKSFGGAAHYLTELDPAAQSAAVPQLIAALNDGIDETNRPAYDSLRAAAAQALGQFGPTAKAAVPALVERLEDENAYVRVSAATALWRINRHAAAVPALIAELKNEDRHVRSRAVGDLGDIADSRNSSVVIPVLISTLTNDEQANVRQRAAYALATTRGLAKSAVPALKTALEDKDDEVRRAASYAIDVIMGRKQDSNAAPPEHQEDSTLLHSLDSSKDPLWPLAIALDRQLTASRDDRRIQIRRLETGETV